MVASRLRKLHPPQQALVLESLESRRLLAIVLSSNSVEENSAHGAIINPANGHAYYLLAESTWQDAESTAINLGGHLVTINDQAEQDWVWNTFNDYHGVIRSLWIGFTDQMQEGDFEWISGEAVTYTNWNLAGSEPDDSMGGEDYAYMIRQAGGIWNDLASPSTYHDSDPICGVVEAPTPSGTLQTVVGTFSGTNPNNGQALSFTLIDNHSGTFAISGDDLVVVKPLNHETTPTANVTVRGADQDGNHFDQTFTINVTDMAEAPRSIGLSSSSVAENQPVGTVVGTLSDFDPDGSAGTTFTFASGAGSADNSLFAIVGNKLKTNTVFDYETANSYSVRVRATDATGFSYEQALAVNITDVYEPPQILLSNNSVNENSVHGAILNSANGHYYYLLGPSSWQADEDAGVSLGGHLVTINDQAEQNWIVSTFGDYQGVNRHLWIGLTDQSEEGVFRWVSGESLTYTNWCPGQPDDYYGNQDYGYIVHANSSVGLLVAHWDDLVSPTPDTYEPVYGVVETQAPASSLQTVVGTLSTKNAPNGQPLTFTLLDNAGGRFVLSGNDLVVAKKLDHETLPTLNLTVRGTDQSNNTYDQTFTIKVADLPEAPTGISLTSTSVDENRPAGTAVGKFSSFDPDSGDVLAFSLVSGAGSTDNTLFTIDGNTLRTAVVFDAQTASSYSIRVRSTDSSGMSIEKAFVINVREVNDAPVLDTTPNVKLATVKEDTPNLPGQLVSEFADAAISDADAGALKGIAVVGVSGAATGQWQFSLDSGSTWKAMGAVGEAAARLLPDSARVRYVPHPNFNGTITISYRAWDQTVGTAGGILDTAGKRGGTGTFSTAMESALKTFTPVNDAPNLNAAASPTLGSIHEDATNPPGTLVKWLAIGASDVDAAALKGIAVVGAGGQPYGHWQFTLDGASWTELGNPSESTAVLLPADNVTRVRFLPNHDYSGQVKLYFRAWDQTAGANGGTLNTAGNMGDSLSISTDFDSAPLTITPVNDAPVLDLSGSVGYAYNSPAVLLAPAAGVSDVDSANFDRGTLRVRIGIGASAANRLSIGGDFTVDASNNVLLNGVTIGIRTASGIGTTNLLLSLNDKATQAIVRQLVRSITFKTSSYSPGQRQVFFRLSDGDGGTSAEAMKTVYVS